MRYLVQVEINSENDQAGLEDWFSETLTRCEFYPHNLSVRVAEPEPSRLQDFPPKAIRRAVRSETYRVVLPGLLKGGAEVTVPVWEPDADPELLAHILDNEGTWE